MITIKKEKKSKKYQQPYYLLKYEYMIGDDDGNTNEKVKVSIDNPFLERYVKLLNSIKPLEDCWGVMLTVEDLFKTFKEKQINEDDYNFLLKMMFDDSFGLDLEEEQELSTFEVSPENEKYVKEFYDGVQSDSESSFSFLVFEGVKLYYVDEFGVKNKTKIK